MLRSLQLNQFRCFESLRLELVDGVTLFVGDNAQGKTSILEAACVLLRLQSPRASSVADVVRFENDAAAVSGEFGDSELRFQYREGRGKGRSLAVDGETQRRPGDYLRASGRVVWMANDDLVLVRGGGDGRRRYLDFMASQLMPAYRPALKAYEKALRSRNSLLKRDAVPKWPEIDAYTQLLAEHGAVLTQQRRDLVAELLPLAQEAQALISGSAAGEEALTLEYLSKSGEADDLSAELLARRGEEVRRRQTVAGPHRDDLELKIDGMPAAKFASEGQQRTLALALKLAQARLFVERGGEPPVLLIDDVFGELDPGRRNALMAAWPEASQKLITTTHLDWLEDAGFSNARVMQVRDGCVLPDSGNG
jgi:DNA replication and repair protein RecF